MRKTIKTIIPASIFKIYHFLLALTGALIYCFPSRQIKVIAVTGTKGKSTSIELIARILEAAGYQVAVISSIKFKMADREWPNVLKMTMPGRFTIQRFLRQAVKKGCQYCILETTSEGIVQYRHKFINCDVVAFTNLEPEHIERHGSFDNYRRAKLKIFQENKTTHIINLDDQSSRYFLAVPAQTKIGFSLLPDEKQKTLRGEPGLSSLKQIVRAQEYQETNNGLHLRVADTDFNLKLRGRFNAYNVLLALSLALSQDIDLTIAQSALEKIESIDGRLEMIIEKPFKVVVDYAHTPGSLKQVYQTLRENYPEDSLVCLLGSCGGGRDKWKRPAMGGVAAQHCHWIILTNEDPYDEDPGQIIADIKQGIQKSNFPDDCLKVIVDRRQAIRTALSIAQENNIIIATGKGSEPWMCLAGGKKIPWQEKEIFWSEFKKISPKD